MSDVVVIGAGVGGLSAAISLAARGLRTVVLEAAPEPGGKAGTAVIDGVEVDTGPSVLTMPEVFDELLRLADLSLRGEVELLQPSPAFRYLWPDGTTLDLYPTLEQTLSSVDAALGRAARAELAGFLQYAQRIWEVAEPRFVRGPAPTLAGSLSWGAMREVWAIDPLRSMQQAICGLVRDPRLRDVLLRYATYAGSDPRRAPATLNCIAHVELGLGGYGVRGGIAALIRALVRAAERLGVELRCGEAVQRVEVAAGRVVGVLTAKSFVAADVVVSNAEVSHLFGELCSLPPPPAPTSTSGWTGIVRAQREGVPPRVAHTVLFPETYLGEFVDLFDRQRPPVEPTVYVCAQAVCHGRDSWPGAEPLFVMVNAPPQHTADGVEQVAMDRLRKHGLVQATDEVVWRRTPLELAARFPGSGGALYGPAHDGPMAAMRRTGQRVAGVRGLYVASGSAHPGGGLPLAALSGRAAAAAAWEDR
jgi:1-hydroxycarotenoid 3,4-desaturase